MLSEMRSKNFTSVKSSVKSNARCAASEIALEGVLI
jgi:hypothetical protein